MKLYLTILKFLFIGALFIVSNENLYLSNSQDLSEFSGLFYSWLSNLFGHALQISGYVINSEWLPGNASSQIIESIG